MPNLREIFHNQNMYHLLQNEGNDISDDVTSCLDVDPQSVTPYSVLDKKIKSKDHALLLSWKGPVHRDIGFWYEPSDIRVPEAMALEIGDRLSTAKNSLIQVPFPDDVKTKNKSVGLSNYIARSIVPLTVSSVNAYGIKTSNTSYEVVVECITLDNNRKKSFFLYNNPKGQGELIAYSLREHLKDLTKPMKLQSSWLEEEGDNIVLYGSFMGPFKKGPQKVELERYDPSYFIPWEPKMDQATHYANAFLSENKSSFNPKYGSLMHTFLTDNSNNDFLRLDDRF